VRRFDAIGIELSCDTTCAAARGSLAVFTLYHFREWLDPRNPQRLPRGNRTELHANRIAYKGFTGPPSGVRDAEPLPRSCPSAMDRESALNS